MTFMQKRVTQKGALYSADCAKCGGTMFAHEWASFDPNEERDAMQAGAMRCPDCSGHADASTFYAYPKAHYAARYSAPGYMDCTAWVYSTSKKDLMRQLAAYA